MWFWKTRLILAARPGTYAFIYAYAYADSYVNTYSHHLVIIIYLSSSEDHISGLFIYGVKLCVNNNLTQLYTYTCTYTNTEKWT